MKKLLLAITLVIVVLVTFLLFPHQYNNAIFLSSTGKECTVYIDGKKEVVKISNLNYPINTVFNYQKNFFFTFNFEVVTPMTKRILVKNQSNYELEGIGTIPTATKAYFFKLNKSTLEPCTSNDIIIGKNNVQTYIDSSGDLMTFIISPVDYKNTRVGISTNDFTSYYHNTLKIISPSKLTLKSLVDNFSQDIPANTEIEIRNTTKGMNVLISNTITVHLNRLYLNGGAMKIENLTRGEPPFNPEYTGTLEFSYSKDGIIAVNELSIEDYLKKIVPSEMPTSGGIEALKCQAVVARTYALSDIASNKYPTLGFYVDDSAKSQIYNNAPENDMSNNSIASTKDLIMTYNNIPIDAKYFNTSCGTGVRYEDVWANADGTFDPKPYFRTVNFISSTMVRLPSDEENWLKFYKKVDIKSIDSASPYFRWNITLSNQDLATNISKTLPDAYKSFKDFIIIELNGNMIFYMPKLENFKDMRILKRSAGGNVMTIGLSYGNANVIIQGDAAISAVLSFTKANSGVDSTLNRLNASAVLNPSNLPSKFFSLEKFVGSYTFYGGGYGHGVGMSQCGAIDLSNAGWDFKRILNLYYKDIVFMKINQ